MTEPHEVARWPRNGREVVLVRLNSFNGHPTIEVRTWYFNDDGELKPGKSGITLGVDHLPNLADALPAALAEAQRRGLMKPKKR